MSTRTPTAEREPTRTTLAILHHLEHPSLGAAERPLNDAGAQLDGRYLRRGDPLPDLDAVDGLIALGGEQSVTELERYPYLHEEAELLREAVEREVPVLGVCLGAQLLAHALGGAVRRLPRRTVEWSRLERTPEAEGDPLTTALPQPVHGLHWNEDGFEPPPSGVELLTRAGHGCEMFRVGPCAWGVQFHPDVDGRMLDSWYAGYGAWLAEAGVSEEEARRADAERLEGQARLAEALFGTFVRSARAARDRAVR